MNILLIILYNLRVLVAGELIIPAAFISAANYLALNCAPPLTVHVDRTLVESLASVCKHRQGWAVYRKFTTYL